jgi:hypothetical protein
MLTAIIGVALALTLGTPQPQTQAAKADPRENLDSAIAEAIRLLEAREHATFLRTFIEPEMLASRRDSFEAFAASFAGERADRLLAMLKHVRTLKPAMSAAGTIATYQPDPNAGVGARSLRWEKTGRYWYIAN